jgi:protein-tyrosine phosphatase
MYRIDTIGRGYLAIAEYPGSRRGARAEIEAAAGQGIRHLVSLLEPAESAALGLQSEPDLAAAASMSFESLPIPDMGLPASVDEFARLSYRLYRQVGAGVNTLVHCRGGIGRSGLLAAAVLLHDGRDVARAFALVSRRRGCAVPESRRQGDWLRANHDLVIGAGAS